MEHERGEAMQKQAKRPQTIDDWRTKLHEAADAHREWKQMGLGDVVRPNVVGEKWFEELRPYMRGRGDFNNSTEVFCDDETVKKYSEEISLIADEWQLV